MHVTEALLLCQRVNVGVLVMNYNIPSLPKFMVQLMRLCNDAMDDAIMSFNDAINDAITNRKHVNLTD